MSRVQKQHIAVYGVMRLADQILLVKKNRGPYAGKWDLPGGRLEHGEKILAALKREIEEEVGLAVLEENMRFWANLSILLELKEMSFFHIGLLYEVIKFDPTQIKQQIYCEDIDEAKWFDLEILLDTELTPFALDTVQKLKNGFQSPSI